MYAFSALTLLVGWQEGHRLMPLPLAPVNPAWFYLPGFNFLVPAHSGSPGQSPGDRKTVVVVVEHLTQLLLSIGWAQSL